MRHRPWHAAVLVLGLGLALGNAPADAQPAADLNGLLREMAGRVQHLGEDIAAEMGQTPDGRHLLQDTREVANAINNFHATLQRNPDPRRVGRSFASIDASWHHLQDQLARRGITPAVDRAARRVAQTDAQLHQVLGLDGFPGPDGGFVNGSGASYYFDFGPPYQDVPLPYDRPHDRVAMRPPFDPVATVVPLADRLVDQTDDFLQRFIPLSNKIPERNGFINDTRALRNAANDLSRAVRRGAPPNKIANEVADLDRIYRRLNARLNRVAKGRPPGPNIVAILQFGDTVLAIRRQFSADPVAPPFGDLPGPFPGLPR